jgi:hypothetical protein
LRHKIHKNAQRQASKAYKPVRFQS